MPLLSWRVTSNPSMVTNERTGRLNPYSRCPTRVVCVPGLDPPRLTHSPRPDIQLNPLTVTLSGVLTVVGVSRCPSTNTWSGVHVTLAACHTGPIATDQRPALEKLSAPSITTPGPVARSTNGRPAAPEAGIVTCSR